MSRYLPGIWFLTLLLTQYGIDALCAIYNVSPGEVRAWSYIGGQLEMTLAFISMAVLAGRLSWLIPLCFWGFVEHAENVTCRLAFPMDKAPPMTNSLQGLCDIATGLPVYVLSLWLVLAAVLCWHHKYRG